MRHARIEKSKRHKKLKTVSGLSEFNFVDDKMLQMNKEQQIPKKLAQIMEFKEKNKQANRKIETSLKKNAKNFNKNHKNLTVNSEPNFVVEKGMTRIPKGIPTKVEKGFLESDYQFLNRLNRMCAKAVAEANLEEHFDVDFGDKIQDETDSALNDSTTDKDKAEKKKNKRKLNNLKRKEKRSKKQHKLLKMKESQEFNFPKDNFQFGEVVHHPPSIIFRKKSKISKQ